jgi:hypothetical protein
MSWLGLSNTPLASSSTEQKVSTLSVEANNNTSKAFRPDHFVEYKIEDRSGVEPGRFGIALETKLSKQTRPFITANEIASQLMGPQTIERKRGKGKKGGIKDKAKGAIFTLSNPPPKLNNFVPDNQVYKITQEINNVSSFTSSTTVPVFFAKYYFINALDQITSIGQIFDQYRIDEVEEWIFPSLIGNTNNAATGLLASVIDYDDATVLSTYAQAEDYTNVIQGPASEGHYRRFKPHVAVASYSGTFTSFTNVESPWIDLSSPSVQHYGLKTAVQPSGVAQSYSTVTRLHISLRNVR